MSVTFLNYTISFAVIGSILHILLYVCGFPKVSTPGVRTVPTAGLWYAYGRTGR